MSLTFNVSELEELMKSFYMLSGIRFVLFDDTFKQILSYPENDCAFCSIMKSHPATRRKCNYADKRQCQRCEKENKLVLYKCHTGLVEAVIPLHENEKIIGYLMFGQITDNPDKSELFARAQKLSDELNFDMALLTRGIDSISFKTGEQIQSAAKIMEACTSYIINRELITGQSNKIFEGAKAYIEEHLGDTLEIDDICSALNIGRTKLYEIFKDEIKMGVSKYILRRRMHRAKKLLKTTDLPIPEIADSVGFTDYNYFSRVFKNTYKKSPKSYRK